jgi:hypothetical protein
MTIAQQLNITTFPFEIKDENGRKIYHEDSYGYWEKAEYDQNGNQIYYENSNGRIMDNRPKPEPEPVKKQTAVEWLIEQLFFSDQSQTLNQYIEQAKAMVREQIIQSNRDGVDMVVDKKPFVTGEQYYNEIYGGDK